MPEFVLRAPHDLIEDGAVLDVPSLIWELEKTVEEHPERWGWVGKICPCGEPAEVWSEKEGYRCWRHFEK